MNRLCFVWTFFRFERYSRADQRLDVRRCVCVCVSVWVSVCVSSVYRVCMGVRHRWTAGVSAVLNHSPPPQHASTHTHTHTHTNIHIYTHITQII